MRPPHQEERLTCSACNLVYVPVQVWRSYRADRTPILYGILPEHTSWQGTCERSGLSELLDGQETTHKKK